LTDGTTSGIGHVFLSFLRDHVLERGGTDAMRGVPAAFIETGWRRCTKHSRNKAQEIQGAVLALAHAKMLPAPVPVNYRFLDS